MEKKLYSIFLVDDNHSVVSKINECVSEINKFVQKDLTQFEISIFPNLDDLLPVILKQRPDFIIFYIDGNNPTDLDNFKKLKSFANSTPVLIIGESFNAQMIFDFIANGALDCIQNDHLTQTTLLKSFVCALKQISEFNKFNQQKNIYSLRSSINHLIFKIRNKQLLLEEICRMLSETEEFSISDIWIFNKQEGILNHKTRNGEHNTSFKLNKLDIHNNNDRKLPLLTTLMNGETHVGHDLLSFADNKDMFSDLSRGAIQSYAIIPLLNGKATIGVLCLYSKSSEIFENGGLEFAENLSTDIVSSILFIEEETKRKKVENELAKTEYLQRAILSSSPAGIAMFTNRKLVWCNENWEQTFGYPMDDIIGLNSRIFFPNDQEYSRIGSFIYKEIEKGEVKQAETICIRKDGSLIPCMIKITRVDFTEKDITFIVVLIDISERKKTEIDLIEAKNKAEESDKLKTAFLSNLSHEVRTPMNAILGFSSFLIERNFPEAQQKQFSEIIQQKCNQLLHIIEDTVEASKISAGQLTLKNEFYNLHEIFNVLQTTLTPLANQKGLQLTFNTANQEKIQLIGDGEKVKKVLSHLINNAIKFTNSGSISVTYYLKDNKLTFSVTDTGIGIEPDLRNIIFDRFRQGDEHDTRKYGGLGLGLSLAKAYVEAMKGSIKVESEPSKGSVFSFEIPYEKIIQGELNSIEVPEVPIKSNDNWAGKKILIAEDEVANAFYLQTILSKTGINILTADNGEIAVKLCKENPDISLILMDIKMPIMSGLEATQKIRLFNQTVPIVACTAYSLNEEKKSCLIAGCDDFLSKPIRKNDLLLKIKDAINGALRQM